MTSGIPRTRLLITILTILVLVAVLGVLYYFFGDGQRSRESQAHLMGLRTAGAELPQEIENASFLLWPINGGGLLTLNDLDYSLSKDQKVPEEHVRQGEHQAIIAKVHGTDATTWQVIVGTEVVVESADRIRSLALSPAGTHVAFARLTAGAETDSTKGWKVVLVSLATGEEQVLGDGFAAAFFNDETLLRFSPSGITLESLDGEALASFSEAFASVVPTVLATDRSRVAFMRGNNAVILNIDLDAGTMTERTRFLILSPLSLEMSGEALYAVRVTKDGGTEIARYPFIGNDVGKIMVTFPPQLAIASITL